MNGRIRYSERHMTILDAYTCCTCTSDGWSNALHARCTNANTPKPKRNHCNRCSMSQFFFGSVSSYTHQLTVKMKTTAAATTMRTTPTHRLVAFLKQFRSILSISSLSLSPSSFSLYCDCDDDLLAVLCICNLYFSRKFNETKISDFFKHSFGIWSRCVRV